jgi:hypothetical protein
MLEAVAALQEKDFRVIGTEVVSIEGGLYRPFPQSRDGIVMHQWKPLNVAQPFFSWYDSWFFDDFQGRCTQVVVKVGRGWAGVWFIQGCGLRGSKEVWFFKQCQAHLGILDDKELGHICSRWCGVRAIFWIVEGVQTDVIPLDLDNSMDNGLAHGKDLRVVMLPWDNDMALHCPRWQVEDVLGSIPCLVVHVKDLYCVVQDLTPLFLFFITVVSSVIELEEGSSVNDVGGVNHYSLHLL